MIQERRTKYTFANRPCLRLLRLQPGQIRLTPLDHSGLTFPSPLSAMVGSGPCEKQGWARIPRIAWTIKSILSDQG